MTPTWSDTPEPTPTLIPPLGWVLVVLRGLALALLVFGGLLVLLFVRLFERPIWGGHRPWSPHITQFVCRFAFVILGIGFSTSGALMRGKGAVVSNHASWLDIFALNARKRIYFVSKAEVARWPAIGWLARATGTVFIRRTARDAKYQQETFEGRLRLGHKLLFFPEGTSTDGMRVLPFKSTLFAAFFMPEFRETLSIQPVSVIYHAPPGAEPRHYSWWGDMDFAPHFLKTLAAPRQGSVEVIYHPPVKVADFPDRKAIAAYCEEAVRSGLQARLN